MSSGHATILARSTLTTIREQTTLRDTIAQWAGAQKAKGRIGAEREALFYIRFGVDVITAQALKTEESRKLTERIRNEL